jgi:hypothetical protein
LKKLKLSAPVVVLAAMADRTGEATAPDLLTKELKKKSPKKRGIFAATVERGATDASTPTKSRYPSRATGTKTSTGKGASSSPVAEDDPHPFVPAGKAPPCCGKVERILSLILFQCYDFVLLFYIQIRTHQIV